jgi:hypothetical protein
MTSYSISELDALGLSKYSRTDEHRFGCGCNVRYVIVAYDFRNGQRHYRLRCETWKFSDCFVVSPA